MNITLSAPKRNKVKEALQIIHDEENPKLMHPFLTVKGLVKRNLLHLAGGLGIGLAGGKKAIVPTAVVMAAKEATDPHPATNNKRWWLKSAIDWTVWTGGAILGASIRRRIGR